MPFDKQSFLNGLAAGRTVWKPLYPIKCDNKKIYLAIGRITNKTGVPSYNRLQVGFFMDNYEKCPLEYSYPTITNIVYQDYSEHLPVGRLTIFRYEIPNYPDPTPSRWFSPYGTIAPEEEWQYQDFNSTISLTGQGYNYISADNIIEELFFISFKPKYDEDLIGFKLGIAGHYLFPNAHFPTRYNFHVLTNRGPLLLNVSINEVV